MVRAKFTVSRIVEEKYANNFTQTKVILTPQYDQLIPEDQRYSKATPCGEVWMQVDNPLALAQFTPGKTFYVDFTEAEPET